MRYTECDLRLGDGLQTSTRAGRSLEPSRRRVDVIRESNILRQTGPTSSKERKQLCVAFN